MTNGCFPDWGNSPIFDKEKEDPYKPVVKETDHGFGNRTSQGFLKVTDDIKKERDKEDPGAATNSFIFP